MDVEAMDDIPNLPPTHETQQLLLKAARSMTASAPPATSSALTAAAAVHADALAVHGLQLGLDREDEDLDVGQRIPAVAAAGGGYAPGRGWR